MPPPGLLPRAAEGTSRIPVPPGASAARPRPTRYEPPPPARGPAKYGRRGNLGGSPEQPASSDIWPASGAGARGANAGAKPTSPRLSAAGSFTKPRNLSKPRGSPSRAAQNAKPARSFFPSDSDDTESDASGGRATGARSPKPAALPRRRVTGSPTLSPGRDMSPRSRQAMTDHLRLLSPEHRSRHGPHARGRAAGGERMPSPEPICTQPCCQWGFERIDTVVDSHYPFIRQWSR